LRFGATSGFQVRVLEVYLRQYFNSDILAKSKRLAPGIAMPSTTKHADYTALIVSLPEVDLPALFGVPDNIDRVLQQIGSAATLEQLKAMNVQVRLSPPSAAVGACRSLPHG
jgi:hypothetical protein